MNRAGPTVERRGDKVRARPQTFESALLGLWEQAPLRRMGTVWADPGQPGKTPLSRASFLRSLVDFVILFTCGGIIQFLPFQEVYTKELQTIMT